MTDCIKLVMDDGITPVVVPESNNAPSAIPVDEAIFVSGGASYTIGYGLKVEECTLMVDAAEAVEADNTKPITSAAVHTEVGNINALLATI